MIDAATFLEDTSGRFARTYARAVHDLYVALVAGDKPAAAAARAALAKATAATMAVAELVGASLVLTAAAARGAKFAAEPQAIMPRVSLSDAVAEFIERAPITLRGAAERTAKRIAELYSESRVVAFVRAAEETVTQEAQKFIARALREGIGEGEAGKRLSMSVEQVRTETEAWSEGYARMVFRTNASTAVTAGRFRQARDPDVREIMPAFRFDAVGDSATRENHAAADGIILGVDSPEWHRVAPPLGYACRCVLVPVSVVELELAGRLRDDGTVIDDHVPADAHPDPGFRHNGRPDIQP